MVHEGDRNGACKKMTRFLSEAKLQGPPTNLHFLRDLVASTCNFARIYPERSGFLLTACAAFLEGDTLTNFLETKFKYEPCAVDVLSPGSFTTVQDFPARATNGHGIPKGGPMDAVSSRS